MTKITHLNDITAKKEQLKILDQRIDDTADELERLKTERRTLAIEIRTAELDALIATYPEEVLAALQSRRPPDAMLRRLAGRKLAYRADTGRACWTSLSQEIRKRLGVGL